MVFHFDFRLFVVSTNVGGVPEVLPPYLNLLVEPTAEGKKSIEFNLLNSCKKIDGAISEPDPGA